MSNPQVGPLEDKFSSVPLTSTLNQYTIEPERCQVEYRCKSVERADEVTPSSVQCIDLTFDGVFDGENTDGKISFSADQSDYTSGKYTPGEYIVTIAGMAVGSDPPQELDQHFSIILTDPCDPPISVTGADFANQDYTLTDIERSYTHPVFTINPDYCLFKYTFT